MSSTIADRVAKAIRHAKKAHGVTYGRIATELGIKQPTVSQYAAGQIAPGLHRLPAIARLCRVNPRWLETGEGDWLNAFPPLAAAAGGMGDAVLLVSDQTVPIRQAEPHDDGFALTGPAAAFLRLPAGLAAPTAWAFYAVTGEMAPRYEIGDLVLVNPARPAVAGSDVVVQILPEDDATSPAWMLARLVRRSAKTVVVFQFGPDRDREIPLSRIGAIERVSTLSDLFQK